MARGLAGVGERIAACIGMSGHTSGRGPAARRWRAAHGRTGGRPADSTVLPREGRRTPDRGSSTVIGLGVASVAVVLALMVALVGEGLRAQTRADTAADLAAIAAVQSVTSGRAEPCTVADSVAERNGATVTECIVRPDLERSKVVTEVALSVRIPGLGRRPVMKAQAVAGKSG